MPFNNSYCAPAYHYQPSLLDDYRPQPLVNYSYKTNTCGHFKEVNELPEEKTEKVSLKSRIKTFFSNFKNKMSVLKARIKDISFKKKEFIECPVTLQRTSYWLETNCKHRFSLKGFKAFMATGKRCPLCRQRITSWGSNRNLGIDQKLKYSDTRKKLVFLEREESESNIEIICRSLNEMR